MADDRNFPDDPPRTGIALFALLALAVTCTYLALRPRSAPPPAPPSAAPSAGQRLEPTRAEALAVEAVAFPAPRTLLVQLRGFAPEGTRLELVSGFHTLAAAQVAKNSPKVVFQQVPAGSELRVALITPDLERLPGRGLIAVPDVFPLSELAVLASESSATVDFRVSCPEPFTVELAGQTARSERRTARFRRTFANLAPDTAYPLKVAFEGPWGALTARVRTRAAAFAAERQRAAAASPADLLAFARAHPCAELTTAVSAVAGRAGPALNRALAAAAASLRLPELAPALARRVGDEVDPSTRAHLLEALALCGHERTRELARPHADAVAAIDDVVRTAHAIALGGGTAGAERIGGLAAREDIHERLPELMSLMIQADRLTARLWFWEWAKSTRPDLAKVKGPALEALGELAEPPDVPSLIRLLFATDPNLRNAAASAIASTRTPAAREAIAKTLAAAPDRPDLWRAAARLRLTEAIPILESRLAKSPSPESTRTLIWALAVLGHRPAAPRIRALLSHADARVAVTAAWCLGELADRDSIPDLTRLANADAVAAHALARLNNTAPPDRYQLPPFLPFVPTGRTLSRGDTVTLAASAPAAARLASIRHAISTTPTLATAIQDGPVDLLPPPDGPPALIWINVSH